MRTESNYIWNHLAFLVCQWNICNLSSAFARACLSFPRKETSKHGGQLLEPAAVDNNLVCSFHFPPTANLRPSCLNTARKFDFSTSAMSEKSETKYREHRKQNTRRQERRDGMSEGEMFTSGPTFSQTPGLCHRSGLVGIYRSRRVLSLLIPTDPYWFH